MDFNLRFGFDDDFFSNSFFDEMESYFDSMIKRLFNQFNHLENPTGVELHEAPVSDELLIQTNKDTDAQVFHTSPSNLPHGPFWRALGIYVPETHTIYIADDLPRHVEKFVYYHEIAHSLGIMDEKEADRFAAKKCGYFLDLGRPRGFIIRY